MKRTHKSSVGLLLILILISPVLGSAVQPGIQNESEMLIKTVGLLEEKPFDKEVNKMREGALKWLIQTDKVSVTVCSMMISQVEEKYKYKSDIFTQYTLGMAAFKLTHPDKAQDDAAAQLGGIESALRFYEAIGKEKPKAKSAFLEDLLAKRAAGSLSEYIAANNCKEKKES